jgi:hypothetical protein
VAIFGVFLSSLQHSAVTTSRQMVNKVTSDLTRHPDHFSDPPNFIISGSVIVFRRRLKIRILEMNIRFHATQNLLLPQPFCHKIRNTNNIFCLPQWPHGLRRRFAAACLLRFWVRFPWVARISLCGECVCVLSGRGLCDDLFTRPEDSYRLWCVILCVM